MKMADDSRQGEGNTAGRLMSLDALRGAWTRLTVAAALLVPWPSEQFACDLVKILCGLNCDPARVR